MKDINNQQASKKSGKEDEKRKSNSKEDDDGSSLSNVVPMPGFANSPDAKSNRQGPRDKNNQCNSGESNKNILPNSITEHFKK